jgi:hypothetical protein
MTTHVSSPCSRLPRPGGNSGRGSVVDVVVGIVVDVVVEVEDVVVEIVTTVVVVDSSAGSATVVAPEVPSPQAANNNANPQIKVIVLTEGKCRHVSARSVIPCIALLL